METFLDDFNQHDLVLRQIEVMGEIINRIRRADPDFIQSHYLFQLDEAVGMRNRIAHQYEGVDLVLVWEVGTVDVPALKAAIVPVLERLAPTSDPDSLHF